MPLVYIHHYSDNDHVSFLDPWDCDSGKRISGSIGIPLRIGGVIPGDIYICCHCAIFKSSQGSLQKVVERQSDGISLSEQMLW